MATALVVEDEPEANKLLAMLVRLRGYQTDSAFTGGEALKKVDRHRPDVVFLDLMLPDINGYEVCEALKSRKTTSTIPVIMVTARVAQENRFRGFRSGADEYIPKPYNPDQIFQALADADDWRKRAESQVTSGEIRLSPRDDGEALRRFAQLRSMLLARTSLDSSAVSRIGVVVEQIKESALAWGRLRRADPVATLDYCLEPDRLTLTLHDASGWLNGSLYHEEGWREGIVTAGFDQIIQDDAGERLTFLKRLSLS
jgi:DNA-binding response OmpR family regulator